MADKTQCSGTALILAGFKKKAEKKSRFDSDGFNSTKDMEITVSPEITLRHVRMSYYSQYWTFCTTSPQCNDINLKGASTKLNRDSN